MLLGLFEWHTTDYRGSRGNSHAAGKIDQLPQIGGTACASLYDWGSTYQRTYDKPVIDNITSDMLYSVHRLIVIARKAKTVNEIHQQYLSWLRKASDCLFNLCGKSSGEVWQGDWHFNWYESWLSGIKPYEAAEDAYAELDTRGLLEVETGLLTTTAN